MFGWFLLAGVASLYLIFHVPSLMCVVAGILAFGTTNCVRFVLMRATAFEVWHGKSLLFSGIDRGSPPSTSDIINIVDTLVQRGVITVKETSLAQLKQNCNSVG
eukprot:TRINITY_DN76598_c0_g1_i1.p1 TRINITY_DN76598_c0_g1~~TRINITY_DN76598_c0_g1_i1.p1  ORF type:complete len:104 (+),score=15.02 TRINITY_DN76598_c0_g1_i1:315-626(+)